MGAIRREATVGDARLLLGDCLEVMKRLPENSVDAVVTDPPYGLSFMGKHWDRGVPSAEIWREALRVLKPGGHLLAFFGTRTYHRGAAAIEDAGFEIRDQIGWAYGSGFPKSHDVSKAIDKHLGAERTKVVGKSGRHGGGIAGAGTSYELPPEAPLIYAAATPQAAQWRGWGTAWKPAWEPVCVARKPLAGTVAQNVLAWGTGGLNIDGCRVGAESRPLRVAAGGGREHDNAANINVGLGIAEGTTDTGRWPANLIHDGSPEAVACFPETRAPGNTRPSKPYGSVNYGAGRAFNPDRNYSDEGSAARFFTQCEWSPEDAEAARLIYCAKAAASDRHDGVDLNNHPTVKPTALMRELCRRVTPPGGTVLDPFMGSGTTGRAAALEGFRFIGIEIEDGSFDIAAGRVAEAGRQPDLFIHFGASAAGG